MTDSQKLDLLLDKVSSIDSNVVSLGETVSSLDNRVFSLEEKVSSLDSRVSSLDNRVFSLEEKVSSMDEKILSLDDRVSSLESGMDSLKFEVTKTNLILENEINHNIKIVAEGHLDLSRKLDKVIQFSNEIKAKQEIHSIYINRHERMLNAL